MAEMPSSTTWHAGLTQWFSAVSKDLGARALVVCLTVALVVSLVEAFQCPILFDFLNSEEARFQDQLFTLSRFIGQAKPSVAAQNIVLVSIDELSARHLHVEPAGDLPLRFYAELVDNLEKAGAKVIGLDVPLHGQYKLQDEKLLGDELKKTKNVVLATNVDTVASTTSDGRELIYRSPAALLRNALPEDGTALGNAYTVPDKDGLVRRSQLVLGEFGHRPEFYKSFALRIAAKSADSHAIVDESGRVFLRQKTYPFSFRINYAGPPGTFAVIPLWKALEPNTFKADSGVNDLAGKIVLVGQFQPTFDGHVPAAQRQYRPGNASFGTAVSGFSPPMSATELQANVVANIIDYDFLREPDRFETILLIVLAAVLTGRLLAARNSKPWVGVALIAAFIVLWVAVSIGAFIFCHWLIPVVVPLAMVAAPCALFVIWDQNLYVYRERRKHTRVFHSIVAKSLFQEIDRRQLDDLGLAGKRLPVTIVACQIRDFIPEESEEPAEQTLKRLNASLALIMTSIGDHKGIVERIWNCGVVAIWGAPLPMAEAEQARLAVSCAREIQRKLVSANGDMKAARFTCGINSGEAVCGTINSIGKDIAMTHYGALGPAVDVAMQLEASNGVYGAQILIGSATAKLLPEAVLTRELDHIPLGTSGKLSAVVEVLPQEGALTGAFEEALDVFRQGRIAFDEGRIVEAEKFFTASQRLVPDDKPTQIMLERCKKTKER